MFLDHIMIPESWDEFKGVLGLIRQNWLYQYFTSIHYIYFIISALVALLLVITKRHNKRLILKEVELFLGIVFLGVILYSILMLRQFEAHDYYFLDTYYLPMVLLFSIALAPIPIPKFKYEPILTFLIAIILSAPLILVSNNLNNKRNISGYWNRALMTIENYRGAMCFMDSLNISTTAKILVLDAYAPNIPFIFMDRHGYAVMTTNRENIEESLDWESDYLVYQNEFFISDIYSNYPEFINRVEIVCSNDKITICRQRKRDHITLLDFLGLANDSPVLAEISTFDSIPSMYWRNITITNGNAPVGANSGFVDNTEEFGLTFKVYNLLTMRSKERILFVKGKLYSLETIKNTNLVVSINGKDTLLYYKLFDLAPFIKCIDDWNNFELSFQIPKIQVDEFEFAIYVWNKGGNQLFYDDVEIIVY